MKPCPRTVMLLFTAALACEPGTLSGQSARDAALLVCSSPHPELFSRLNGARELSDGRLVVSDWVEERVAILDFASGDVIRVGATGSGPRAFRAPGGLLPFRGDSTLLVDLGNTRFAVLGPSGAIARTLRGDAPGVLGASGADGDGRLYYVEPGWAVGLPPDSPAPRRLLAFDPSGVPEVIGMVDVARPRSDAGRPRDTPGIPFVVFAARDGWAVAPDRSVAVVRWDPFRVEWLRDGTRTVGSAVVPRTEPVTAADRREFVEEFVESSPMSGRGADGGLGQAPAFSDAEIRQMIDTNEFAESHAPFDPASVQVAPDGRVWLVSSPPNRSPVRLEVFGRDAEHAGSVELPTGRRLLRVGRRHVYVTTTDDLGLQRIERCVPAQ